MNSTNQLLLRIMIGIVALMGLIAAVILVAGNMYQSDTNGKIIFITYSLLIYGITGSFCYAITRKRQYNGLAIFGITISAIAFLINVIFILGESRSESLIKAMISFFFLAFGLAQVCFLLYITTQNKLAETIRIIAIAFISLFTLLVVVKVFDSWESLYLARGAEKYMRYVIAVLILQLTTTLLTALCNQIRTHDPNDLLVLGDPPAPTDTTGFPERKDN